MTNKETKVDLGKSERIEAERMKALKALNGSESDVVSLSYLDPRTVKIKGWSNDANVILASAEKMGNRSIVSAFAGVALGVLGYAGSIVSSTFKLGMAGIMITGLPSGVSFVCMGVAALMAMITIVSEIIRKVKSKRKFSVAFWSAFGAIVVMAVYCLVGWLITRFN